MQKLATEATRTGWMSQMKYVKWPFKEISALLQAVDGIQCFTSGREDKEKGTWMAYWPGAGGRRSREVAAAGRCRSVGAETGVGEKEAKAGSQKDLEAGQRMTEKRSLSAEVAIEAKKQRKKTGRGVRARLKVRVLLRSLAVRAESLTGKSLQRKRMGRRFALKVKRRRRRRSKERKSRSKGRKGKERKGSKDKDTNVAQCWISVAELGPCFRKPQKWFCR